MIALDEQLSIIKHFVEFHRILLSSVYYFSLIIPIGHCKDSEEEALIVMYIIKKDGACTLPFFLIYILILALLKSNSGCAFWKFLMASSFVCSSLVGSPMAFCR